MLYDDDIFIGTWDLEGTGEWDLGEIKYKKMLLTATRLYADQRFDQFLKDATKYRCQEDIAASIFIYFMIKAIEVTPKKPDLCIDELKPFFDNFGTDKRINNHSQKIELRALLFFIERIIDKFRTVITAKNHR